MPFKGRKEHFPPTDASAESPQRKPSKQSDLGLYLTARDAYPLKTLDPQALLIDIRPREEIAISGMPAQADANIPYLAPSNRDTTTTAAPDTGEQSFLKAVEELVKERGKSRQTTIILICLAGAMAARAANLLTAYGYRKIFTVVDGFEGDRGGKGPAHGRRLINGWKNSRLPWRYPTD